MAGIEPRQSVSQDQVHNHNTPLLLLMSVVTLPFEPRISPLISNSLNVAMVAIGNWHVEQFWLLLEPTGGRTGTLVTQYLAILICAFCMEPLKRALLWFSIHLSFAARQGQRPCQDLQNSEAVSPRSLAFCPCVMANSADRFHSL